MLRRSLALLASLIALPALAVTRPATPVIIEPAHDHEVVSGADVHMVTAPFSDEDGDAHRCTDWEIARDGEPVWQALCVAGPEKIHIHLADGQFTGDLARAHELPGSASYVLRVRHRDDSGDASEWSEWAAREFETSTPSPTRPMRLRDVLTSPAPAWSVVPPHEASLRVESIDGVELMEMRDDGFADGETAQVRSAVRVVLAAGEPAWELPESELTLEDENGASHTVYLPAASIGAGQSVQYWVSANGSTHPANAGERAPAFDEISRGAPVPWRVMQRGFVVERAASGFQLPVNIAFVADPAASEDSPLYYVAELYGDVKVVTRGGEVRDFATGLLDFDPTGHIPGSGESGLAGIAVDSESGDLFVTMVSWPDRSNRDLVPNVVRLRASDDGLTMVSREPVLILPNEKQSASHQISNVTIGPDRKLYVHFGDSVRAELAQDLSVARGKILRMNMDGTAPADNPYYDDADGITARDYIFASGFRNPFGGAWRASDQSLYELENGPSNDRLARVVRGRNYGWDGTNASMFNYALCTWTAPSAPVQIAWVQRETFDGSGFPEAKMDTAFVTESGPTWASAEQPVGKRISEVVLAGEQLVRGPAPLIEYDGSGKATVAAIAAGPDGLYFSDLYKDYGMQTPVDRGANVFRIRWTGYADFVVRPLDANGLIVSFTDRSNVPAAATWRWDFGDGATSSERSPQHRFASPGAYIVRLSVDETITETRKVRVGPETAGLLAEYFARVDFTEPLPMREEAAVQLNRGESEPFSVRWTGTLTPRFSETYRFAAVTTDHARVLVGGQVVLDGASTGEIELEAGRDYDLIVEYQHESGPASLEVTWESAHQTRLAVPRTVVLPRRRSVRY